MASLFPPLAGLAQAFYDAYWGSRTEGTAPPLEGLPEIDRQATEAAAMAAVDALDPAAAPAAAHRAAGLRLTGNTDAALEDLPDYARNSWTAGARAARRAAGIEDAG